MSWSPALAGSSRLVAAAPARVPFFSLRFVQSAAQVVPRPAPRPTFRLPQPSSRISFSPSPARPDQKQTSSSKKQKSQQQQQQTSSNKKKKSQPQRQKQREQQRHPKKINATQAPPLPPAQLFVGCPDPADMSIRHDWPYIFKHFAPPESFNEAVYETPAEPFKKGTRMLRADVSMERYQYSVEGKQMHRVVLSSARLNIRSIGDNGLLEAATKFAQLSFLFQMVTQGFLTLTRGPARTVDNPPAWLKRLERRRLKEEYSQEREYILPDGTNLVLPRAQLFFGYYCAKYALPKPETTTKVASNKLGDLWDATVSVGESEIGHGKGLSKKTAETSAICDAVIYLVTQDRELWASFVQSEKEGTALGLAPRIPVRLSRALEREVVELSRDIDSSDLYRNTPAQGTATAPETEPQSATDIMHRRSWKNHSPFFFETKSQRLKQKLEAYRNNPEHETMRAQRESLPVMTRKQEVLDSISQHQVSVCMAATGSGKTTQIPQILLDDAIERGEGANCNIICTQPRRIAAISVAQRVAKERGETIGQHSSIGYQVRFESALPEQHGSVTFCTTGILLKRLQSYFTGENSGDSRNLDLVSHIVVDEVHERDVDTDLLLVVLKRLIEFRGERNQPIKIVLMSATIDPTLFQEYFKDDQNVPAPVFSIPGRSFPVDKHFLEGFIGDVIDTTASWVFEDKNTSRYLKRELMPHQIPPPLVPILKDIKHKSIADDLDDTVDDLDIPFPLVAATIARVMTKSEDGHVLVFLPGWEEIQSVNRILTDPAKRLFGVDFTDSTKYSIHLLHSTIPVAEQQQVFEPPQPGVRRVILSTNIAETSVTIPDVVYVVDTAKTKENRYDPTKHMTSLVSSWVGSSNLNQRAGRAGRHRPGEYYGLLTNARYEQLQPHQTVEMKRADLSNVVMHIKALHFPGMTVQEVLAAAIEPPDADRIEVAMKNLKTVGALDNNDELTPLGRILLHIPVDVQLGVLVLYGCFFRCLSRALTLAAILSNRDPFVTPPMLKQESLAAKVSWTPPGSNSDILTTVAAYEAWADLYNKREYQTAHRFCIENFVSRPTLILIHKIRAQLLHSLYTAGVIDVSAGGALLNTDSDRETVPAALNENASSLPLLFSLISLALQPKFAVRVWCRVLRTTRDKVVLVHPNGVNAAAMEEPFDRNSPPELYSFIEKRQNISVGSAGQTFLVGTTRLEPLPFILFGAHEIEHTRRGLECDKWILFGGDYDTLADIHSLRKRIDACMRRVFDGISKHPRIQPRKAESRRSWKFVDEDELVSERDYGEDDLASRDHRLSTREIQELDFLTRDVVKVLDQHSAELKEPFPSFGSRRPSYSGERQFQPDPSQRRFRPNRTTSD